MTPPIEDHTDRLFHALSDMTRRDILRRTLSGEHSITTLAGAYAMSFAAVQKHVDVVVPPSYAPAGNTGSAHSEMRGHRINPIDGLIAG